MAESKVSGRLRQRIIQASLRRYSIRLEPVFWAALERIARDMGVRINALVEEIANRDPPPVNLAGSLREFCLVELVRMLGAGRTEAGSGISDLGLLLDTCPAPCLVLGIDRTITHCNKAFGKWFGKGYETLLNRPLDKIFITRGKRRLTLVWKDFMRQMRRRADLRLVHVVPGRTLVADAIFCPLGAPKPESFSCVVWIIARRP